MTVAQLLALIVEALGEDGHRFVDVDDLQAMVELLALASPELTEH